MVDTELYDAGNGLVRLSEPFDCWPAGLRWYTVWPLLLKVKLNGYWAYRRGDRYISVSNVWGYYTVFRNGRIQEKFGKGTDAIRWALLCIRRWD